jgi:hypothetical protein
MPNHHKGGSVDGRPASIKPEIRNLITNWATEDEQHKSMDRELLADELIDEIEKRGEIAPTVKTLKAMISTARNQGKEEADYPWSMSTLREAEFSLPLEAIPYVVKIQQKQKSIFPLGDVTIRQAQWIARLCKVVKDPESLSVISWYYALYERISNKAKTPFDTTKPDSVLPDKEKVIAAFQDLLEATDFKAYKLSFDDMATTKLVGVAVIIKTIYLQSGNVFAVVSATFENENGQEIGKRFVIVKDFGVGNKVLPQLIQLGLLKKQKNFEDGYINLKKPVAIQIPQEEWIKIQNGIKSLVKRAKQEKEGKING